MKPINIAVVGIGYWGPNLVRNFLKIPNTHVSVVCDISQKNLTTFKQSYPFIKTTTDIQTILKDKTIDLVAIATPVVTHFQLAQKILNAKKHVLLEKPMTKTVNEAETLIKRAKEVNRQIFVGHTFVYAAAVRKMKELIDKKALGRIFYIDSIRINTKLIRSDVNVLWDLAPHDLAIIDFLIPEKPSSLQSIGSGRDENQAEIAHIILKYASGMIAVIHVNWLAPVKIRTMLIGGSKKMISYDDNQPSEKIKIYNETVGIPKIDVTPFTPAWRSGDILIPHLDQTEPLLTELTHFIDCIRKRTPPQTGAKEGLSVVKLLEAADISMRQKKEIYLP